MDRGKPETVVGWHRWAFRLFWTWRSRHRRLGRPPFGREVRDLVKLIVLGEQHLRRILTAYFSYYDKSRTHLSLGKDAPEPRAVHPPSMGSIVEIPEVGGLHHRYERRAA
jgi:hypothetical protein